MNMIVYVIDGYRYNPDLEALGYGRRRVYHGPEGYIEIPY
jgi:hypothetical protein